MITFSDEDEETNGGPSREEQSNSVEQLGHWIIEASTLIMLLLLLLLMMMMIEFKMRMMIDDQKDVKNHLKLKKRSALVDTISN